MGELYSRIEQLCRTKNLNITQMCREAGVARANLTELKKGRSEILSSATLKKIAIYFNVSVDYLLNGTKNSPSETDEDEAVTRQLHDFITAASPAELDDVMKYIEFIKSKRK